MKNLINKLAKWGTLFVYPKRLRHAKRILLIRKLRTMYYGRQVLKTAKSIGFDFACNNYSTVTSKTKLKDDVNFNGMKITGGGNVIIGNHFHSGEGCLIITQNHNYDKGAEIRQKFSNIGI